MKHSVKEFDAVLMGCGNGTSRRWNSGPSAGCFCRRPDRSWAAPDSWQYTAPVLKAIDEFMEMPADR
jgi:hypothetical protein